MSAGVPQAPLEIVVFEVAGQRFGVRSIDVRELVRAATLTAAPRSHPAVIGLLNLRGQVMPVFDLRRWLGLPDAPLQPADQFIVTRSGVEWIAIRGEGTVDLASLNPGDIEPAGSIARNWTAVTHIARVSDRLVLLLEPEQLWSPDLASGFGPLTAELAEESA